MADAVVSFALQKFRNLLLEEGKLLYGVNNQVKSLQTELTLLHSFLKDADARRNESQYLRNWNTEIRELVYDAEDIIEAYVLKVESKGHGSGGVKDITKKFGGIFSEMKARHKVGSKIEVITTKISQLAKNLQRYGIIVSKNKEALYVSKREQRHSFAHIAETNVVGLDDSIKELVGVLIDETHHSRVVSICGMGGLGKTTLAKIVYHHSQIRKQLKLVAWTYISQQCQRRDVWAAILSGLTKGNMSIYEHLRDEELAEKLYKLLQDNKCLVVLDDIWSIEAWDVLKAAFPNETNSKILLTSRNKQVVSYADPQRFLHEPQCLKEEDSWELFKKMTFIRKDGAVDGRIEELGKQMVKRCAGLPLAIIVLGGLLGQNINLKHWQKVQENLTSYITKGSSNGEDHSPVFDVFSLSYDSLPTELKQCFLYLGHFPEDYEISVEKLKQLWLADGLITSMGENVEDVAEEYLDELIKRSMVLVGVRENFDSSEIICRLHDIMRDLCLLKVQEENFLKVINPQLGDENEQSTSSLLTGHFRRLAVQLNNLEHKIFNQGDIKSPNLRSLLYINSQFSKLKLVEATFNNLKLLRVLDLEGAMMERRKLSKDIGKLVHLRFLSLRDALVTEFPPSLENLRLLETLDLRVYVDHLENFYNGPNFPTVPNVLWKMARLRHLYLPYKFYARTDQIRLNTLRNLETLENFQLGICKMNDLFSMSNLRRLTMYTSSKSCDFEEIMPISLCSVLKNLQFLSVGTAPITSFFGRDKETQLTSIYVAGFVNLSELVCNLKITKLPESHQFPLTITSITLGRSQVKDDPMPILEKLRELRGLLLFVGVFILVKKWFVRHKVFLVWSI